MMLKEDYNAELKSRVSKFEEGLKSDLPLKEGYAAKVIDAMSYSALAGGKRLRPMLMQAAFELFCNEDDITKGYLDKFMCAIEYIHTYSLVHDDLPAMDNDEYRRGRLTTWKVYGDGMGVLSGDALLNYAFEVTSEASLKAFEEDKDSQLALRCVKASAVLSKKSGYLGMIGGQCADLEAEDKKDVSIDELTFIHEHKTGCLIEAALMVGGILGGAGEEDIKRLEKIGSDIGIAFQIRDDILDVIGDSKELGKKVGSDEANGKVTFVTMKGIETSKEEVETLSKNAEELLSLLPGDKSFLLALFDSLIGRMS